MFKELYKLYQLMEFFVINHHYKTIAVRNLVRRDEIWLANPDNYGSEIIRLSLSSLEYIENDEERINQYIDVIKKTIKASDAAFLDIHVGQEEVFEEEIFDTVMIDSDYYDGLDISDRFPKIKNVVHESDNPEAEINRVISSINASVVAEKKQKKVLKASKFHLDYLNHVIIALCIISYIICYYLSKKYDSTTAYILMGADYRPFTLGLRQYWRLLTVAFNHGSLLHLGMNMYSLFLLGHYFEDKYGKSKFLIVLLSSIVLGSLTSGILTSTVLTVGISGGLYGLMAFFIIDIFTNPYANKQSLYPMIIINLAINFMGGVSWSGHLGGFVAGVLLYYAFKQKNKAMPISVFAIIVVAFALFISKDVGAIYPGTDFSVLNALKELGFKNMSNNLYTKLMQLYASLQ